jgi:hypothetical protein
LHCHGEFKPPDIPSLDFLTTGFLRGGAVSPTPNPNLEDQGTVFMFVGNRMAPRQVEPILVAFYNTYELRWDVLTLPSPQGNKNAFNGKYLYVYNTLLVSRVKNAAGTSSSSTL